MRGSNWGGLRPDQVADWINFDARDPAWHYRGGEQVSMPSRQAEGVAGLWNKLSMHGLALLADEVGMGKTFQALGVLALLWKLKPHARVLIMAPNYDICQHWAREYRSFLNHHYRGGDHLRNGDEPLHTARLERRLPELVEVVETGNDQLFLTTIYALSNLVSRDKKSEGDLAGQAGKEAASLNKRLRHTAPDGGDGPAFDLLIVDEAHYFRNASGSSQRSNAAQRFFGEGATRLAEKVLLMTATPSHSSLADVASTLSYFTDTREQAPVDLLKRHALRRLRLMEGVGGYFNKHNYRHEQAVPASFEANPQAEMFFALYQKKLVQQQVQAGANRRFLYGYLEGFESVGARLDDEPGASSDAHAEHSAQAFSGAPDTQILHHLTQMHREHFDAYPEHPKYGVLLRDCQPDDLFDASVELHEHKHLVFVRRIASVREITQRLNEDSDAQLAQRIIQAWQPDDAQRVLHEWKKHGWSRSHFNQFVKSQSAPEPSDADLLDGPDPLLAESDEEHDAKLASRIADLFVVKKQGERSTDCSNFSLRLRKPESLFSLLMEPASDYRAGTYRYGYRKHVGERDRDDYGAAALAVRLALHSSTAPETTPPDGVRTHDFETPLPTLWGLLYEMLPQAPRQLLDGWLQRPDGPAIAENFGNYLKAGLLFASPVIVELYGWFTAFNRQTQRGDAQQRYLAFVAWLTPRLQDSLLRSYFIAALESFEALCEKITDHGLADWKTDWRALTSLQSPAWFASSQSGNRQRLILGFNSPFYPNVLVATSVFQEGVNLHLQCRKVHHYGIAWTPGDNEQRIGRVDRLFGRVNRQLREQGSAELSIRYPYLTRSFDQEQLASFVLLKQAVETRIDACRDSHFDDQIDLRNVTDDWQQYLRAPTTERQIQDPYPACFDDGQVPRKAYRPAK